MARSKLEEKFALQLQARAVATPERELKFGLHLGPKKVNRTWYRFDFAWPEYMIAVEIQGGVWSGGKHASPVGIRHHYQKYNQAVLEGWWVLQGDETMLRSCQLVDTLVKALATTALTPTNTTHGTDRSQRPRAGRHPKP